MDDGRYRKDIWPCPKRVLYAQRERAKRINDRSFNYANPIYNDALLAVNPVWPGQVVDGKNLGNKYGYIFIATFEDNFDNGWNQGFATGKIRCRGPFLIAQPERYWNFLGRMDQWDTLLVWSRVYHIDGAKFEGFALEAATWQVASGYERKQDTNMGRILSGVSRFG
jgi:hypothetical protein